MEDLIAWCWAGDPPWLVVANLGSGTAAGLIRFPLPGLTDGRHRLVDSTHAASFDRAGRDLLDGLYVELGAGDWHLWRVEPAG